MTMDRRDFLKGAGAGALLLANPSLVRASLLGGPTSTAAERESKLFADGKFLVHADMHNHTLLSDGAGNPTLTFASMRAAGLDVAAVTDHTTVSKGLPVSVCGGDTPCSDLGGLNDLTWEQWRALADAANVPGLFTAIRGFEWSSPSMGHVNVWFSETYTDPLHDAGGTTGEGGATFTNDEGNFPSDAQAAQYDSLMRQVPTSGASMALFYEWLAADPSRPIRNGGADAICGFNHPGREVGRFGYFDPRWRDAFGISNRVVSLELFNRGADYLFQGTDNGQPSPLSDCLDKGWKVGILGVTDEHGTDWGVPDGKGRTGMWVAENTREAVREAMLARRFFATNLKGLRLDATLDSVRMGQTLPGVGATATVTLDIDRGPGWVGRPLHAQVLASGYPMPTVLTDHMFTVPGPSDPPVTFTTPVDADDRWVVVRISDPAGLPDGRADASYRSFGKGIAYASPFFITR
jgi:hypothetical protein